MSSPEPLGATLRPDGVNFAVFSEHAERIEICLFDAADRETARFPLSARSGDVFHGFHPGIREGQRYGLRAYGRFDPRHGHRFDPTKLLLDPYAAEIDRSFRLDRSLFGRSEGQDSAAAMPKAVIRPEVPSKTKRPETAWGRTVLYEAHIRGFSQQHPAIEPEVRGTFAALAAPAAIAHFHRLGVTAVETLPIAASIDERHLEPLGLVNYWGYNPVAFMAPDPRLAPGGWPEIAATVDALHREGIEVILDVVFNHSGEGDQFGPTLSLRGLDNARYYRLRAEDPSRYLDDAGCGNTLNCADPQVVRLIMDALRRWAEWGGVDGFRFDLASTLGRRQDGFDPAAPLFAALLQDPLLRGLKLIAEAWDIGPGGYQVGSLPAPFADWNDRYRDTIRRFWRGDTEVFGEAATRLSGSQDLFARRSHPSSSINFIVAHDGFTLADLVSFERKANHANGEGNRDGTNANHSWNNGIEGPTADPDILARRRQDQRNLIATLMLSLGTPMLLAGSELGQSQAGNNNAYAQDNALSWLNWEKAEADLAGFVADLAAFRASHPIYAANRFLTGQTAPDALFPDVVWLNADGTGKSAADWQDGPKDLLAAQFALRGNTGIEHRFILCLHRGAKALDFSLPPNRNGFRWNRRLDTAASARSRQKPALTAQLEARSVVVFEEIE